MANIEAIRKEIVDNLNVLKANSKVVERVEQELDMMEVTDHLDGRSNLEVFHEIWDSHRDERGSENKANSWTAWALGMTSKKPDGKFLPKRRAFARAGFPDVDMDFEFFRRGEIYDYLIEKYGRDNVGNIGTYSGLKLRSAVRRIGKAIDIGDAWFKGKDEYTSINENLVTEIIQSLPRQIGAILKVGDVTIKTIQDAYDHCHEFRYVISKYPGILRHSKNIEGLLTVFGTHAAGIVIGDEPIEHIAPLRRARKNEYSTQYAYEDLEQLGLIKFDILALSTLSVIKECVKLVKANYGIDVDIRNIDLKDAETLALFRTGRLKGVFQCETKPMQHTMIDIGVDSFRDVTAAIALFRPGPIDSIPEYCARKRGDKAVDYFHPAIEPKVKKYLESTYGVLAYQEQVMQIVNALAGFSISDGYVMIKAIGKKKKALMDKFEKQFVAGCVKNGVPENVAQQYWDRFITPFSSYGFNLSHSCCYGYISFITAFLKAHYPDEFFCALLNVENSRKNHDKVEVFEADAKKFGIVIADKEINKCKVEYVISSKKDLSSGTTCTVITPSLMVKGIGMDSARELARKAPYKSLRDISYRTDTKQVDLDVIGCLIDAGFFERQYRKSKKAKKFKARKESDRREEFRAGLLKKFKQMRDDQKKAFGRGVDSGDLFSDE